jgi:hypothetical protein
MPPFVCGGICAGNGGACTTAADCCPGLPCTAQPGSTRGTCGYPPEGDAGYPPPPPPTDAAVPEDATTPPYDAPADGPKPPCADYGQVCTASGDCCNGVPCAGGRCVVIVN